MHGQHTGINPFTPGDNTGAQKQQICFVRLQWGTQIDDLGAKKLYKCFRLGSSGY